jgi:cystathionine beta-lyase/cystathionine gamma-synthase
MCDICLSSGSKHSAGHASCLAAQEFVVSDRRMYKVRRHAISCGSLPGFSLAEKRGSD